MAVVIGWALFAGASPAHAVSGAADGTYTVTVTKVEISKDLGTTWITIFSGSRSINIASVSAGAAAASLANGASCEVGTYERVRVTLGPDLVIKGYVNDGGTTFYTNGTTFGGIAGNDNTTAADYTTSTVTIPVANRVQLYTGLSIVILQGKGPKLTVTFDTTGVIAAGPTVNPPTVTLTTS